jgi:hypothetical protein
LCIAALSLAAALGCGASPTGGPDPAPSTFFKGTMVDGAVLPYRFFFNPLDFGPTFLIEARLVPLDLGRTTDKRIFDDRGGSGSNPGNGRDTTVATGRMSDIRTFANSAGVTSMDSAVVDVVRIGDIMYITRPHPDPNRNLTDTAVFTSGVLVRPLRYWRTVVEPPTGRTLTYTTVK